MGSHVNAAGCLEVNLGEVGSFFTLQCCLIISGCFQSPTPWRAYLCGKCSNLNERTKYWQKQEEKLLKCAVNCDRGRLQMFSLFSVSRKALFKFKNWLSKKKKKKIKCRTCFQVCQSSFVLMCVCARWKCSIYSAAYLLTYRIMWHSLQG